MEIETYAVYIRMEDPFGMPYHQVYSHGQESLETARRTAREASQWGTNGQMYLVVKETKTVEFLDGEENRFLAQHRRANEAVARANIVEDEDWD